MIPQKHKGKYFFYFSHLDNLESIIKNGILPTNEKENIEHLNVAANDIQCTRNEMLVTCKPNGSVHDYVPFYFCARTPMFLSILKSRNFDQPYFIYIALNIENLENDNFIFTDGAANKKYNPPNFYSDPENLDRLNWDEVNSKSWGVRNDTAKHERMAEALHFGSISTDQIDYIVVWNESVKEYVEDCFRKQGKKCPPIEYDGAHNYHHYYLDLAWLKYKNVRSSLVSGPKVTKSTYKSIYKKIKKNRKSVNESYLFDDIERTISSINYDFFCIQELKEIVGLKTDNRVHSEDVDEHTKSVVKNLISSSEYADLRDNDKLTVELSAYLHDIGKGPKKRWADGIQKVDDDHPRKSALMLERILSEDIDTISNKQIRQIVMLVMYHDFFGDHIVQGRKTNEICSVLKRTEELDMLYALSKADVMSINSNWYTQRISDWHDAYNSIKEQL